MAAAEATVARRESVLGLGRRGRRLVRRQLGRRERGDAIAHVGVRKVLTVLLVMFAVYAHLLLHVLAELVKFQEPVAVGWPVGRHGAVGHHGEQYRASGDGEDGCCIWSELHRVACLCDCAFCGALLD